MNNTHNRKGIRHREEVYMPPLNTERDPSEYDYCSTPKHHKHQQLYLTCGRGINIDLENIEEGEVSITLARVAVDTSYLENPLVKIDFSTLLEVENGNEVELVIALKRSCHGECVILEQYELEFDNIEFLPFSFTYCDHELWCHKGCCTYTVEIIRIDVEEGTTVNEIETKNTAINAIVQG